MNNKILKLLMFLLTISCTPTRNIVYFSDLKSVTNYSDEVRNRIEPKIQPDDLLSIAVSSLNPESNILFNNGVLQTVGSTSGGNTSRANEGYLVDRNGSINFPVLGSVKLSGLTKEQATDTMTSRIRRSIKNPIVNIKFLNFKITVVGEVNRPSSYTIPNERINIVEAIGLAGDLTVYGKRENILVIREKNNLRTASRLDITSKSIFDSPAFYLQQNDIVYVEPVKTKKLQSGTGAFYLPIVSLVVSTLSVLIFLIR